jgi:hypothetical protein
VEGADVVPYIYDFFGLQAVRIVVDTVHGVRVDRLLD